MRRLQQKQTFEPSRGILIGIIFLSVLAMSLMAQEQEKAVSQDVQNQTETILLTSIFVVRGLTH